eukprot:tig00020902_g14949.t1
MPSECSIRCAAGQVAPAAESADSEACAGDIRANIVAPMPSRHAQMKSLALQLAACSSPSGALAGARDFMTSGVASASDGILNSNLGLGSRTQSSSSVSVPGLVSVESLPISDVDSRHSSPVSASAFACPCCDNDDVADNRDFKSGGPDRIPTEAELWKAILQEARNEAASEPDLASFLWSTILSHGTLYDALCFRLAHKVDHAIGVVIGETAVVGDNVSFLHNVTLGGNGKVSGDRHPKIGHGVLLGAHVTVLGNIKIGPFAKIGAGSVVLTAVPARRTAVGVPARVVGREGPKEVVPAAAMDHHVGSVNDAGEYVLDFQI